jgi:hypothetical protein
MANVLTRRLTLAFVILLITVPLDAAILRALTLPTELERANHWAASLTEDQRIRYVTHGNIPLIYFQAVRRSLSASETAQLFVNKISSYRRDHAALSQDQEELLDRIVELMKSGQAYSVHSRTELTALAHEGLRLFPSEFDQRLLLLIGPPDNIVRTEPGVNRFAAWLLGIVPSRTARAVGAELTEGCACSLYSDYCGAGKHCCDGVACQESVFLPFPEPGEWIPGCGALQSYKCDGLCHAVM